MIAEWKKKNKPGRTTVFINTLQRVVYAHGSACVAYVDIVSTLHTRVYDLKIRNFPDADNTYATIRQSGAKGSRAAGIYETAGIRSG